MRVIAGRLRGRALRAPRGRATRPTSDRVREALFSILGDVSGARVLDLYAGSGALGIEALSRGAAFAAFVESAPGALACIRHNLSVLELEDHCQVIAARVERGLRELRRFAPFDLVLCDPPWTLLSQATSALGIVAEVVSENATLAVEHPTKTELIQPSGFRPVDRRRWGDTAVSLFARTT